MDAKHARNSTDHQSLMRPLHHNWPFGYVARCSARLVLTNALVSRDLANFLVGYAEVTRRRNAERRVHLLCCHKNVILIATNGGKMRTKGE